MLQEDNLIDKLTADRTPHDEPFGWHDVFGIDQRSLAHRYL
jgi:hypothetical protein